MRYSDITGKLYRRGPPRQYNLSAISEYLTTSTTPFDVSAAAAASLDMMNVMNQNYCGYTGGNHGVKNIC